MEQFFLIQDNLSNCQIISRNFIIYNAISPKSCMNQVCVSFKKTFVCGLYMPLKTNTNTHVSSAILTVIFGCGAGTLESFKPYRTFCGHSNYKGFITNEALISCIKPQRASVALPTTIYVPVEMECVDEFQIPVSLWLPSNVWVEKVDSLGRRASNPSGCQWLSQLGFGGLQSPTGHRRSPNSNLGDTWQGYAYCFNPQRATDALPTFTIVLYYRINVQFQSPTGISGSSNLGIRRYQLCRYWFQSPTGISGSSNSQCWPMQ
jgi:hypothetical protein